MKTTALGFFFSACLATLAFACGSSTSSGEAPTSNGALTGTTANARSCATRDAYLKATLADLKPVAFAELSPAMKKAVAENGATKSPTEPYGELVEGIELARLVVPVVGDMLVITGASVLDNGPTADSYFLILDGKGSFVVYGAQSSNGPIAWYQPFATFTTDPDSGIAAPSGLTELPLVCPNNPPAPDGGDGG